MPGYQPEKSLKKSVLRGTRWTAISFAITFTAQFVQYIFLARFLEPSALGQVAVFTLLNGLADILLGMGLTQAIIQRRNVTSKELGSLYWLNIGISIIIAGSVYLSSSPIANFLNSPDSHLLIKCAAPLFLITAFSQTHRAVLEKRMLFGRVAAAESTGAICMLLTTLGFILIGYGALSAVFGLLMAGLIRTIFLITLGRRYFRPRWRFKISETLRFLSFGIFQTIDTLTGYVTASASTVATGRFVGGASMGGYNLAYNTAVNLPSRINPVMTRVLFPVFSKIQGETERMGANYLKVVSAASIVSVPLLTCLALVAGDFVEVVYGKQWLSIAPLISLLCVVGILRSLGNPVGFLLQATDNMKLSVAMNILKLFITIPLVAVGSSFWGALGAAYGILTAQVLGFALTYLVVRFVLSIELKSYLSSTLVTMPIVVPMGICVALMRYLIEPWGLPAIVNLLCMVAVALIVLLAGFFLSKNATIAEFRGLLLRRVK